MREYVTVDHRYNTDPVEIRIHNGEAPRFEASLAVAFIEKWGMAVAKPVGEDSAGRQALDVMTPAEVVERACEMARLAVDEFRKRGWTLTLPNIEEEREKLRAAKADEPPAPEGDHPPPRRRRP